MPVRTAACTPVRQRNLLRARSAGSDAGGRSSSPLAVVPLCRGGDPAACTPQNKHAARAAYAVKPLTMCAYLRIIRSNQPQRLFLPVVTPHS